MNNLTKTTLAVAIVGILGFGGLTTVAVANSVNYRIKDINNQGIKDEREIDETSEGSETAEIEDTQESAHLQPFAKISATQATEAALTVQNGQVKELELTEEDG